MAQDDTLKASPRGAGRAGHGRPQWWQWFFLYPVFGVALVSAVPEWIDKAHAVAKDLGDRSYKEAKAQQILFERNIALNPNCLSTPFVAIEAGDIKVDPVLCHRTGDILLRYETRDGNMRMVWVDLRQHLDSKVAGRPWGAAVAGVPDDLAPPREAAEPGREDVRIAQTPVPIVVCVKQEDARTLLRHVSEGGTCFDERIDTMTGWLKSRTQVPCRGPC